MKSVQLGITGGIGSGNLWFAGFLKQWVFLFMTPTQKPRKSLIEKEASSKIKKLLGEKAYLPDGNPDRKYMAECIFSEPALRNAINEIVHPLVRQHYHTWVAKNSDVPIVAKEAAIMFESGAYVDMDFIAAVVAPLELRKNRIRKRDQKSDEAIESIIASQLPEKELIERSDFVIHNDEKQLLHTQILQMLHKIQPVSEVR
ncbi:MAG: dephospho-CoA kinase [Bacteroidetes bacterium]|nr:dephospho-CoA kinase [Bacteroidota bacterium]